MTEKRDVLRNLQAQREMLEVEANCIAEELMSPGLDGAPPAGTFRAHPSITNFLAYSLTNSFFILIHTHSTGLKDPLIDKEGYPRGDVDIMKVLEKRKRLSTINYDHKEVMSQIERLGSFMFSHVSCYN